MEIKAFEKLNSKIELLYLSQNDMEFPPMFYSLPSKQQKILSLGLNPSLTEEFKRELTLRNLKSLDKAEKHSKIIALIAYQNELKKGQKQIQYFKNLDFFFKGIEKEGYNSFEKNVFHYDLYQIRDTNSKKIISEIKGDLMLDVLTHLELVVYELNPKIIFVFNAMVSNILKTNFLTNGEIDKNEGCYFYNDIPVILANQLSGGATSNVYRDMLIWNANRIINNLKR